MEKQKHIKGDGDDFRRRMISEIVKHDALRPYWRAEKVTETFTVWATPEDVNCQREICNSESFAKELRLELQNAELQPVTDAKWFFKTEALPENARFYPIAAGLYLEIQLAAEVKTVEPTVNYTQAKISIFAGKGSLSNGACLLDADKQTRWNIGRGALNGYKENHIAIEESKESPFYDFNKYVSRSHARIEFSAKTGFRLYVNIGGRHQDDNRTRIIRNEQIVADMNNELIPESLQHNDLIELSKSVVLQLQITN
jgi:hypothetical protein